MSHESRVTRRHFCAACIGAAVGIDVQSMSKLPSLTGNASSSRVPPTTRLERCLTGKPFPQILGQPHDGSLVRQGWHPFSPERVVILPHDLEHTLSNQRVKTITAGILRTRPAISGIHGQQRTQLCQTEKAGYCIRIMKLMTDYYCVPQHLFDWSRGLIERESLATSRLGIHTGIVHQFQRATQLVTRNAPVDWWLFLAPHGIEFLGCDDEPAHVLVGLAVTRTPWFDGATVELGAYYFMSQLFHPASGIDIRAVSRMDRRAAARQVNSRIPELLATLNWHRFAEYACPNALSPSVTSTAAQ